MNTRPTKGLGLGLALVREILALHGTDLEIQTRVGSGSRFSFRLPLGQAIELGAEAGSNDERTRAPRRSA
jgi:signal transduction histidine kinase